MNRLSHGAASDRSSRCDPFDGLVGDLGDAVVPGVVVHDCDIIDLGNGCDEQVGQGNPMMPSSGERTTPAQSETRRYHRNKRPIRGPNMQAESSRRSVIESDTRHTSGITLRVPSPLQVPMRPQASLATPRRRCLVDPGTRSRPAAGRAV